MNKKKEDKQSEAKEPLEVYGDKSISFSASFEEDEEETIKWLASLSPEQHLHNALKLIKRVYGITDNTIKKPRDGNIYFD